MNLNHRYKKFNKKKMKQKMIKIIFQNKILKIVKIKNKLKKNFNKNQKKLNKKKMN